MSIWLRVYCCIAHVLSFYFKQLTQNTVSRLKTKENMGKHSEVGVQCCPQNVSFITAPVIQFFVVNKSVFQYVTSIMFIKEGKAKETHANTVT